MKQSGYKKMMIGIFITATFLGFLLPGVLLHFTFDSELNRVKTVSEKYYNSSGSVMSKNASAKLSEYEKIKLISGAWDSTQEQVDVSESGLNEAAVVELARAAVGRLYKAGAYAWELDSSYDNWYSWEVQCFRCTENAFRTYSAYCFLVTFLRYDSDEEHVVLLTENGTLLAVSNNRPDDFSDTMRKSWNSSMKQYFDSMYGSSSAPAFFPEKGLAEELPSYECMRLQESSIEALAVVVLKNANISTKADYDNMMKNRIPEDTEVYFVYQQRNSEHCMLTIIPQEQNDAQHYRTESYGEKPEQVTGK